MAEQLYRKKFKFEGKWKLPDLAMWFNDDTEVFQVPALEAIKKKLKGALGRLGEVEVSSWIRHNQFSNQTGMVTSAVRRDYEPEMCTQV